jgi:hypothetical protein
MHRRQPEIPYDVLLHVMRHTRADGPEDARRLMSTCRTLWRHGMYILVGDYESKGNHLAVEPFLRFLLTDPDVRIPMLVQFNWLSPSGYDFEDSEDGTDGSESVGRFLIILADVFSKARNLELLGLSMWTVLREPRVADALVKGCPNIYRTFWMGSHSNDDDAVASLAGKGSWPLQDLTLCWSDWHWSPYHLLINFADTLEQLTLYGSSLASVDIPPIFSHVHTLRLQACYDLDRARLFQAFPSLKKIILPALGKGLRSFRNMHDPVVMEETHQSNAMHRECWKRLDQMEGTTRTIYPLALALAMPVRELEIVVDLDVQEDVARLFWILKMARPVVLELQVKCKNDSHLKCLWDAWNVSHLSMVRSLDMLVDSYDEFEVGDIRENDASQFTVRPLPIIALATNPNCHTMCTGSPVISHCAVAVTLILVHRSRVPAIVVRRKAPGHEKGQSPMPVVS